MWCLWSVAIADACVHLHLSVLSFLCFSCQDRQPAQFHLPLQTLACIFNKVSSLSFVLAVRTGDLPRFSCYYSSMPASLTKCPVFVSAVRTGVLSRFSEVLAKLLFLFNKVSCLYFVPAVRTGDLPQFNELLHLFQLSGQVTCPSSCIRTGDLSKFNEVVPKFLYDKVSCLCFS